MASVAMLMGGALVNALTFTSSSYLFHRLSVNSIDAERARHHLAIEQLQEAQIKWAHKCQQRTDFINKGQTIIFYQGVTIFGTCRQFFSEE